MVVFFPAKPHTRAFKFAVPVCPSDTHTHINRKKRDMRRMIRHIHMCAHMLAHIHIKNLKYVGD